MSNQIKQAKILSLVAIVLLCANLFVWFGMEATTQTTQETSAIAVTQVPIANLAAILIANDTMSLGVMQQNGSFEIIAEDTGSFDSTQVLAMVYTMCNVTAEKAFTDTAIFGQYGIDAPTAQATLFLTDGTEYTLQLLDKNTINGSYYLYDPQAETVYLVGSLLGEMLGSDYSYYYSKTVFPVVSTANYLDIQEISMDFGQGAGNDYTITQQNGIFSLTQPITQQISAVTMLSQLVSYLSALYAEEVVATDANLSDYGLDTPDLTVSMTMADTVYQGALLAQEDGSVLLADLQTNTVYLVQDANYAMLASDYVGLMADKCFSIPMGDLSRLQFATDSQQLTVNVKAVDASIELTVNGIPLEQEAMVAMTDTINSVALANQVTTPTAAAPVLTMTATYSNGTQRIYTFAPNQSNGYDVCVDGITNFATTQASFQALLDLVAEHSI